MGKAIAKTSVSTSVVTTAPEAPKVSRLKAVGGSDSDQWNTRLLNTALKTAWLGADDEDRKGTRDIAIAATMTALEAFEPKDPIEAMMAAQAVGLHNAAMECMRRSMMPAQPFEAATKLRKDAANMSRAMTDMLAALDRKRGKGQQHIRVERVMIGDGGQAIVGNVTTPQALPPSGASGAAPMAMVDLLAEPQAEPRGEGEHDD